jgi:Ca2+-binding EF-hand superfamily protein
MKTILVSTIIGVGILAPMGSFAETPGRGGGERRAGEGRGKQRRQVFSEVWQKVDANQDGFISKEEFDAMPRIKDLPDDKRQHLFKRLDKNGDGKLKKKEMSKMSGSRGRAPMQHLWALDVDKSGGVSLEEFRKGRFFKKLPEERQVELFGRLDTDQDGVITPKDRPVSRDKGRRRPDSGKGRGQQQKSHRQMMRRLDTDGDGALSFDEFCAAPVKKKMTEDEQEDRFEAMDSNHDQKLSPKELRAAASPHMPDRRLKGSPKPKTDE